MRGHVNNINNIRNSKSSTSNKLSQTNKIRKLSKCLRCERNLDSCSKRSVSEDKKHKYKVKFSETHGAMSLHQSPKHKYNHGKPGKSATYLNSTAQTSDHPRLKFQIIGDHNLKSFNKTNGDSNEAKVNKVFKKKARGEHSESTFKDKMKNLISVCKSKCIAENYSGMLNGGKTSLSDSKSSAAINQPDCYCDETDKSPTTSHAKYQREENINSDKSKLNEVVKNKNSGIFEDGIAEKPLTLWRKVKQCCSSHDTYTEKCIKPCKWTGGYVKSNQKDDNIKHGKQNPSRHVKMLKDTKRRDEGTFNANQNSNLPKNTKTKHAKKNLEELSSLGSAKNKKKQTKVKGANKKTKDIIKCPCIVNRNSLGFANSPNADALEPGNFVQNTKSKTKKKSANNNDQHAVDEPGKCRCSRSSNCRCCRSGRSGNMKLDFKVEGADRVDQNISGSDNPPRYTKQEPIINDQNALGSAKMLQNAKHDPKFEQNISCMCMQYANVLKNKEKSESKMSCCNFTEKCKKVFAKLPKNTKTQLAEQSSLGSATNKKKQTKVKGANKKTKDIKCPCIIKRNSLGFANSPNADALEPGNFVQNTKSKTKKKRANNNDQHAVDEPGKCRCSRSSNCRCCRSGRPGNTKLDFKVKGANRVDQNISESDNPPRYTKQEPIIDDQNALGSVKMLKNAKHDPKIDQNMSEHANVLKNKEKSEPKTKCCNFTEVGKKVFGKLLKRSQPESKIILCQVCTERNAKTIANFLNDIKRNSDIKDASSKSANRLKNATPKSKIQFACITDKNVLKSWQKNAAVFPNIDFSCFTEQNVSKSWQKNETPSPKINCTCIADQKVSKRWLKNACFSKCWQKIASNASTLKNKKPGHGNTCPCCAKPNASRSSGSLKNDGPNPKKKSTVVDVKNASRSGQKKTKPGHGNTCPCCAKPNASKSSDSLKNDGPNPKKKSTDVDVKNASRSGLKNKKPGHGNTCPCCTKQNASKSSNSLKNDGPNPKKKSTDVDVKNASRSGLKNKKPGHGNTCPCCAKQNVSRSADSKKNAGPNPENKICPYVDDQINIKCTSPKCISDILKGIKKSSNNNTKCKSPTKRRNTMSKHKPCCRCCQYNQPIKKCQKKAAAKKRSKNKYLCLQCYLRSVWTSTVLKVRKRLGFLYPGGKCTCRKQKIKRKRHDKCNRMYLLGMRHPPHAKLYKKFPIIYPRVLTLINVSRQFFHLTLFSLAALVWCPCIVIVEACRMCCCCC